MKHHAEIKRSKDNYFCVEGVLNFHTVAALRDCGNDIIAQQSQDITFDLKLVTRSDSAGLALLAAWVRYANQQSKSLRFMNIPNQMLDVAKLSNLDRVLPL